MQMYQNVDGTASGYSPIGRAAGGLRPNLSECRPGRFWGQSHLVTRS